MPEPSCAVVWCHLLPDGGDQLPEKPERPCGQVSHVLLDPRPRHFNGIELGTVGGQVQGGRAELCEGLRHAGHAMDGGTIHDHDVTFVQAGAKVLAKEVQEDLAGDVSIDLAQRADAIECNRSDEVESPSSGRTLDDRGDPT